VIRSDVFRETIRYTVQGLALFVLFSVVLSGSQWLNRALTWKPIVWIGLVSYTLYLCHFAIYAALRTLMGLTPLQAGLVGAPLAFLYAQAMRIVVEVPILRWRRQHAERVKSMVSTPPLDLMNVETGPDHRIDFSSDKQPKYPAGEVAVSEWLPQGEVPSSPETGVC
jgi:peptidoglycan/LPS O-acetylase OafA/YrhL